MSGHIDLCTRSRVAGWALADARPAELDVFVNGAHIARIHCEQPRPDQASQGLPLRVGFAFTFPQPLDPTDEVSILFLDGIPLNNSPLHPFGGSGHLDLCTTIHVAGWALGDKRPTSLGVFVNDLHVGFAVCDQLRPDLESQGFPADVGFLFRFPCPIAPLDKVSVRADGVELANSPQIAARYYGRLDCCTISQITGWLMENGQPVMARVLVNNTHVGDVRCDHPRSDLASQGLPFYAGFQFRFPQPIALSDEVTIQCPDGTVLDGFRCKPTFGGPRRIGDEDRRIVLVVGMHRSGTSLCSNVLSLLGIDMTDDLMASQSNERGHWERREIVEFHDRILRLLSRDWASPHHLLSFPPQWWVLPEIRAVRDDIIRWLQHHWRCARHFGFKDPRTARMLPLWKDILLELDLKPRYVFCVRDPAQVARSLAVRDGLELRDTEFRWMVYNSQTILSLSDQSVCIIPFEDWFCNQGQNLARIASYLNVSSALSSTVEQLVAQTIDPRLRHDDQRFSPTSHSSPHIELYGRILNDVEHGRFGHHTLSFAQTFASFEEFVQPLLTAQRAEIGSSAHALPALTRITAATSYPASQVRLAEGIAGTILRYSEALKEILNDLEHQAAPADNRDENEDL